MEGVELVFWGTVTNFINSFYDCMSHIALFNINTEQHLYWAYEHIPVIFKYKSNNTSKKW